MADSVQSLLRVYLARRESQVLLLAPGPTGIPEPLSVPYPLLKVAYISRDLAGSDENVRLGATELQGRYPTLMLMFPSPDGPPYRCGFMLSHTREVSQLPCAEAGRARQVEASEYAVACTLSRYTWGTDVLMGRPGYFLSGGANADHMWRVARVESDFAGRQVFSLVPVRLDTALPAADFMSVDDALLRDRLIQHWNEVQASVRGHLYGSLVTAAKNVAEALITYALADANRKPIRGFAEQLKRTKTLLDAGHSLRVPLSEMDLYLMHKLRLLHARTHPDRVIREARPVSPELALTAAPDIAEVLVSVGLAGVR